MNVKSRNRLFLVGVLCVIVTSAAQAGNQLFEGSWSIKAFGNQRTGGTGESEFYSAFGLPQGIQCNPNQPRCPYESTPTDGSGNWAPLGGHPQYALFCAPWYNWRGYGTDARPSGDAYSSCSHGCSGMALPSPPFYRNPNFFTSAGQPNATSCTAISTGATPGGKGLVQAGQPVTGKWTAATTGTQRGGFSFARAPAYGGAGIRTTGQVGEFNAVGPYIYSYTYATLRNTAGVFGPGNGPGAFSLDLYSGLGDTVANINVKQGGAKFGGTMTMLGALTSKACYYRHGGCSLGSNNWRYDAVGTPAHTSLGVVTRGYVVTYRAYHYHTNLMQMSTINVEGLRFPWTTGSATVTATARGPHKTVHYAHGYDNRNTTTLTGKGTIQLVSPVLTRWLQPASNYETGGMGILKIKFMPEPHSWAMLLAGVSLLGVGYRMRGR
jgi:hypothetical protein